jgi:hypothetical protein
METTVSVETDHHEWALHTAQAIRERRFDGIDWDRVAEELHDLGLSQEHKLESQFAQLIYHLLKIEFQPERHGASWDRTVREQRKQVYALLRRQPSLKTCLSDPEFMEIAYSRAVAKAGPENLPDSIVTRFPEHSPFTVQQLLPEL